MFESEKQIAESKKPNKDTNNLSFFERHNPFRVKNENSDLIQFTKDFAELTNEGMSTIPALKTISTKIKNQKLKKIILESITEVQSGTPLYICFRKYPDVFENIYCDLIKIGEETGRINKVLERLLTLLESRVDIVEKTNNTIQVTSTMIIHALVEAIFLLAFIVPPFAGLLERFTKPILTVKVLELGLWFQSNLYYIIGAFLAVLLIYLLANLSKIGRYCADYLKIKMPLFGKLIENHTIILYSRNIVAMYNSGTTFIESMKICNKTIQNLYLKRAFEKIVSEIENGNSIIDSFNKIKIMPNNTLNIIEHGEESGYIDQMFIEIADKYEKNSNSIITSINTYTKPIIFTLMFIFCGLVFWSLCSPLYNAIIWAFFLKH